jgi:hypothetical protein
LLQIQLSLKKYSTVSNNRFLFSKLFCHPFFKISLFQFWVWPIRLAKQIGSKEFILNAFIALFTFTSAYSQINFTDSANSTKWPIGITGDTAKFKRSKSAVFTNSLNSLKHQFQLNFYNSQVKSAQFHIEISSEINLSSSNFLEFGFTDSTNQKIQFRIGNTLDQLQVFKNDTIVFRGQENEFNVPQFHYSFDIKIKYDTVFLQKINIINSAATFDTLLLNNQFRKTNAYLKIQQYGTTAIGKINYNFIYFGKIKMEQSFPEIDHFKQINNHKISIDFKKPIQPFQKSQCQINNLTIDSISFISNNQVLIHISNFKKIKRDSVMIKITNIKDLFTNNKRSFDIKLEYTYLDTPSFGDIILTEIMSKPSPSLGLLPEKKYIEIYNRSSKFLDANTLYISDSKGSAKLPTFVIEPFKFYLCVNETDSNFFQQNPIIKVKSLPSFNIESDFISLKTTKNEFLFQFEYFQNMHQPDKSDGGYSLEKTNINMGTLETDNWQSNSTQGGTPGIKNSNDTSLKINTFKIIESFYKNDTLTIKFNHNTNPNNLGKAKFLSLSDTITLNYFQNTAKGFCKCPKQNAELIIPIQLENTLGNKIQNLFLAYNAIASNSNIKFNEILFHNFPSKPDFIEIINTDTTAVFLENINLKIFDENFQNFKSNLALKNKLRELIIPNEILAFTSSSNVLRNQFPSSTKENTFEINNFPNFSSEGGSLLLTNIKNGITADKLTFNDKYHSPNIANPIGISLEKNSPNAESSDYKNWQSAIESSYGATPGLSNSVYTNQMTKMNAKHFNIPQKRIINQSLSIAPLHIDFQFPQSGYICNAIIFNKFGQLICESIKNQRLTQEGTLTIWPSNYDQILPNENYIIKLEAFYPNGDLCREIHRFTVLNQ